MKILGIETSCDETAVCVVEAEGTLGDMRFAVLGNALFSQADMHAEFGGVYPNLAKREHARNLVPLLETALSQAQLGIPARTPPMTQEKVDALRSLLEREPEMAVHLIGFLSRYSKPAVDAIAVTHGPGLEPALWVGVNFARALSMVWDIPVVAVNHMEGHVIISALLGRNESIKGQVSSSKGEHEQSRTKEQQEPSIEEQVSGIKGDDGATRTASLLGIGLPVVALLISGGHTEIDVMREWFVYERVGQTRDDAVGEAFDKVARLLGLPYPGGPHISRLAREARTHNLPQPFKLPRPMQKSGDFDFSFSGIKTSVRVQLEKLPEITDEIRMQMAREFEDAVTEVLISKTLAAAEEYGAQTIILGGGVSANTYIKEQLAAAVAASTFPLTLIVPPAVHATDNAIMIALAGYFHAKKGTFADISTLRANGTLSLHNS